MPNKVNKKHLLVKHADDRLKVIDLLVSNSRGLLSREQLLVKVNTYLPYNKKRTVQTLDLDIKELRKLLKEEQNEVTLQYDNERGYHYFPDSNYRHFKESLDDEEQQLLLLASSLFSVFEGTPLQDKFSKVVERVMSESVSSNTVEGGHDLKFMQLENMQSSSGSRWVSVLLEAIYEKSTLKMRYKGFGKALKTKNVCPYVLKQYHKRWYMVGYDYDCTREEKTNVFALDCIEELELSHKNYYSDPKFSAEDYFKYSIGVWHWHEFKPVIVELAFTRGIESILASPLHSSQKAVLNSDTNTLHVTIEVFESPELESLIRSYGSAVKVLSPTSLRDKIVEDAKKVVGGYKACLQLRQK